MAQIAMLIPDVNLLVYAYNEDAPFHAASKAWWETRLSGDEPIGLSWAAMLGFIRIMSNRRALISPMPPFEAVGHCRLWLAQPNVCLVTPGPGHLDILARLLNGAVGSNLVTDAHLAALAIEHQAELHSNDSDFARFSGLKWHNPVAEAARSLRRRNSRKRKFGIAAPLADRLRRILAYIQRNRSAKGADESGFAAVNSYGAGS